MVHSDPQNIPAPAMYIPTTPLPTSLPFASTLPLASTRRIALLHQLACDSHLTSGDVSKVQGRVLTPTSRHHPSDAEQHRSAPATQGWRAGRRSAGAYDGAGGIPPGRLAHRSRHHRPRLPAGQVSGRAVTGSFSDAAAITTLASQVDVLTVEIEHVDADALQAVADAGHVVVHPAPATLKLIQDKLLQKQHLGTVANVALGDFLPIGDLAALLAAGEAWGYPLMLKARKGAYDGRGNAVVSSAQAAAAALASLGGGQSVQLYAERWCPFVRELALMVARSANGQVVAYPVVETVQRENQCHAVIAPARISSTVSAKASAVAEAAIRCLSLTHPFPPYVTAPFPLYITDIFCRSIGDQIARGRGHLWRRAV